MKPLHAIVAGLMAAACAAAGAQDAPRTALKVCQDPNNLPFSNERGEGIENRIAELFGKALGLPVTYYSFPQRLGFIRNTLRFKLPGQDYPCDIVLGVPAGFEQVSVTKPYYRSTYALVYAAGRGLDGVSSGPQFLALDRERLAKLRIGLYDRSPASAWLAHHGLVDSGVPYPIMSPDPQAYPGQILERDLAEGRLDAAIVWGPIAGFVAQRAKSPKLVVVPLASEPGVKFDFSMAMGVRYGEREWKQQVEQLIERHRAEITAILQSYGVPLLEPEAASK
ncbi:substrate-binding domain-containing protein [Rubrivivax gelatinosus]|uniref:ABC transporter substrate-binding protein n=1 Tax=Rubrivivax gelatinosus TaxID=28068 RepID=A0ABS1DTR7_RUBGE|nr:substrate-binding domain-containing protein [Rubrivivax gelatinosus]MBK1713391.1 ABC transporter substrate-binding protein [Rubrivivax gelatinosus]